MNEMNAFVSISAERLVEDPLNNIEGEAVDDIVVDGNNLEINRVLDNLRDEIRFDESVAMKSAVLLKLLEVSKDHCLFDTESLYVHLIVIFMYRHYFIFE